MAAAPRNNGDTEPDPITGLARRLSALDALVTRTAGVAHRNERNRLNMLVVHAIAALMIAPQFAVSAPAMSGPAWIWLRHIPLFPWSMATLMGVGGAILLPSTLARARWWEIVGLNMLAAWYLIIAVGFGGPQVPAELRAVWTMLHGHVPHLVTSIYGWNVYGHLCAVMLVHLSTLRRIIQGEKRGTRR